MSIGQRANEETVLLTALPVWELQSFLPFHSSLGGIKSHPSGSKVFGNRKKDSKQFREKRPGETLASEPSPAMADKHIFQVSRCDSLHYIIIK